MLWDQNTLQEAIDGVSNDMPFLARGISLNTRSIKDGDIFIAIDGGEAFVEDAFNKGAVCAIVPASADVDVNDKPIIRVDDTFQALVDMGQYKRDNSKAKFIAITGSVGKTGTKNMLADVLSSQGETYSTKGNFNNHYGVPLTLASMPDTTEFAVIELGMSARGEISNLVKQVRPDVALITMIAECHIEFFESIDGIAQAKSEIFEDLNGVAVINKSSPCFDLMERSALGNSAKIMTFGDELGCDIKLNDYTCHEDSSDVEIKIKGDGILTYSLPIPGEHIVLNSCGVFAVLKALDLDLKEASEKIEDIKATEGRGEKTTVSISPDKTITIIDEAYNASPKAMIASVKKLSLVEHGRKILVIGDMLELGETSKELHLSIVPSILESNIDKVYCCGEFMRFVYDELPANLQGAYAENSEKLLPLLEKDVETGDNLLIKGSNGSKMGLIVNFFKDM